MNYKRHLFFEELRRKIIELFNYSNRDKEENYRKKKFRASTISSYMCGYLNCLSDCKEITENQLYKLGDVISRKIDFRFKRPIIKISEALLHKRPTVLEFVKVLEREAKLYRENKTGELNIPKCLDRIEDIVDDFRTREEIIGMRNYIAWCESTYKNNERFRKLREASKKESK